MEERRLNVGLWKMEVATLEQIQMMIAMVVDHLDQLLVLRTAQDLDPARGHHQDPAHDPTQIHDLAHVPAQNHLKDLSERDVQGLEPAHDRKIRNHERREPVGRVEIAPRAGIDQEVQNEETDEKTEKIVEIDPVVDQGLTTAKIETKKRKSPERGVSAEIGA